MNSKNFQKPNKNSGNKFNLFPRYTLTTLLLDSFTDLILKSSLLESIRRIHVSYGALQSRIMAEFKNFINATVN